ncbi:Tellurium resistance [Streptomyces sp. NPDC093085]|uniref:Tellurium resistance n=1 Tax=Streptomyces sp. NPDC093085 TaxID=3155068 RepID=UPI003418C8F2
MAFWDNLWQGQRASQFDSSASSSIELTKRRPTVSLSKLGSVSGNLRVNLSWSMRTSDIMDRRQSGKLFGNPLKLFKPEVVQAHTQGVVNVDLDLGCLYELKDGTKGVVQPLGNFLGDLNEPPYVKGSGDDRFGAGSGETLYVNLDKRDEIKRLLFFVYIYDQTPAFNRTHAHVTLYPANGVQIEIDLDDDEPQARSCAVFSLTNVKGDLVIHREVKYVYGFQAELDRLYGWGLQWGRGYKAKT